MLKNNNNSNMVSKCLFGVLLLSNVSIIIYNLLLKKKSKVNENENKNEILEFKHTKDRYGGIIIDETSLPINNNKLFELMLEYSLLKWKSENYRGVWLKIPNLYYSYLSILYNNHDYINKYHLKLHHSQHNYFMFTFWLDSLNKNTIPDYVFTCIAARAFVVNKKGEIIVVTEKFHNNTLWSWHLPGGVIDRGENIMKGCIREIKEETGINTQFINIISFRHTTPFRFGNTDDILFICLLKAIDGNDDNDDNNYKLFKHDHEIDNIKWMKLKDYLMIQETQEREIMGFDNYQKRIEYEINKLIENWDNIDHYKSTNNFTPVQCKHPSHPNCDMQLYYAHY
jgi:ADP-ribose pyrophosphatase YjhB (NUDIX family)